MAGTRNGTVVFVINDIELKIAPENISVQMEDLVYSWKTLRTSSSTKIPSGHGQSLVQARIPFMDSDILALHRLIIELQHSPFCYVENEYLRRTLCPEWPSGQKMAFTVTGLDLLPYPGTTNASLVNLEMIWFNYFPYVHNWLYREDWTTNWLSHQGDKAEPYYIKTSIGWDIDEFGRKTQSRLNIVDEKTVLDGGNIAHQEWSTLNETYLNSSLTIDDFELLHRGEIFDLLPLPSQMEPSGYVGSPGESMIYKRYINFLQRDALKKNFGIDLEAIIGYEDGKPNFMSKLLFGKCIVLVDGKRTEHVQALHETSLPSQLAFPEFQAEWYGVQERLVNASAEGILFYKQNVEFAFATYKSVQLPNQVAVATQKILEKAKKNVVPRVSAPAVDDQSSWLYADDNSMKIKIRRGLSEPAGFHTPIGWKNDKYRSFDILATGQHDFMHWRSKETLKAIYGRDFSEGRFHWGLDISDGCIEDVTPVYAVKDGEVLYVAEATSAGSGRENRWKVLEKINGAWERSALPTIGTPVHDDWITSRTYFLGGNWGNAPTGTVISSLASSDRLFYVDFGDGGQNVEISHNLGKEISKYLHLSEVLVEAHKPVKAGQIIGYVGRTSTIAKDSILNKVLDEAGNIQDLAEPIDLNELYSDVAVHLHFEYYERADFHASRDTANTDQVKIREPSYNKGYIVVDPRPTWQWAAEQGYDFYIESAPAAQPVTMTVAKEAIESDVGLTADDKNALVAALDFMHGEGYFYYDRQSDITNVWWKPWRVSVTTVNPEEMTYDDTIRQDTAVLTNITCGLRHVVANIPILGHEFPTQQHLGSIEPYYNMEFHLLDDTGTLEGIGERGAVLTALRFLLQNNGREFRSIPDSWCLLTDSFYTRLLGTFRISDLLVARSAEDNNVISDFKLARRTMISRASHDTIEGNPGLSRLVWELQETNPYSEEVLEINAPSLTSMEEARSQVLNKIYNLDFISDYKNLVIKLLIAQAAGANTTDPTKEGYGTFQVKHTMGMNVDSVAYTDSFSQFATRKAWKEVYESQNTAARVQHGDDISETTFLLKDDNQVVGNALRAQGILVTSFNGTDVTVPGGIVGENSFSEGTSSSYLTAITEAESGLSQYKVGETSDPIEPTIKYVTYNIADLLRSTQVNLLLAEIPITRIIQIAHVLRTIVISAEMYLAEETSLLSRGRIEGSPLPTSKIIETLYKLPINPHMLRSYQDYLLNTAAFFYSPELVNAGVGVSPDTLSNTVSKALSSRDQVKSLLEKNPNWLMWKPEATLPESSLRGEVSWWDVIGEVFQLNPLGLGLTLLQSQFSRIVTTAKNAGRGFVSVMNGSLPDMESYWGTLYHEQFVTINNAIAKGYVRALPLIALSASEQIKDVIEDSIFGDLVGGIKGESNLPAIANTQFRLEASTESGGNFGPHPFFGQSVPFFLETLPSDDQEFLDLDLQLDSAGSPVNEEIDLISNEYKYKKVSYLRAVLETTFVGAEYLTTAFDSTRELFEVAQVPVPGSPYKWYVESSIEEEKLRYFKQILARLADKCLRDPAMLRVLGLEGLAGLDRDQILKGKNSYPDLDIPDHPFYGNVFATYPDFYMWNMYEDGDVLNSAVRQEISKGMETVLTNAYNSINKLQSDDETGDKSYKLSSNKATLDPTSDENVTLNIKYNAEGTEGMATPFYPTEASKSAITDFFNGVKNKVDNSKTAAQKRLSNTNAGAQDIDMVSYDNDVIENLSSTHALGVRLENGAGYYGAGAGVQYPSRLSASQYERLKADVASVTTMFGSRAGYALEKSGKKELPDEVTERLNGTPLQRQAEPSHEFDLVALKQLAENSSHDLFSQKRRMARAYPTFKLYFIEEDEWENRLLNFDDFYSYNAVKDFTVTMSRKTPGDTAVVTLQNISGTLDGTKRDAIVDLDYFGTKMKGNAVGANPVTQGTVADQPFGALVLRPGLNCQLRVGYSNDPDNLSVLINGRVVDVQWNQVGDTAQIMIQSFGTELLQVLKGTSPEESNVFYTTHQLLGSLMLEPELQHFGRWEIGQAFMTHEATDYRFDFNDYSKEAHMGRFEYSSKAVKWFFNHPLVLYGLAIGGLAAASRLPGIGGMFGKVTRWGRGIKFVDDIAMKLGIAGRTGVEVYEKELVAAGTAAASKAAANAAVGSGRRAAQAASRLIKLNRTALITGDSYIDSKIANEIIDREVEEMVRKAVTLGTKDAGDVFGAHLEILIRARKEEIARTILANGAGLVPGPSGALAGTVRIRDAAEALAKLDADVSTSLLRGQWFTKPMGTATGVEMLKDIGGKPIQNIISGSFTGVSKVLAGAAAAGLVIDAATWTGITEKIYEATVGRAEKYFAATQASLMLSPQDDNLFPPHPKDYMLTNMPWTYDLKKFIGETVTSVFTDEETGNLVGHYFADSSPFDKRVPVKTCEYVISNSYIWDIFQEMSLRHPGWVYGIRPYGNKFRYTMFFGVPSQRYWAAPADTFFIERANKLESMLNGNISVDEYRSLYGDYIGDTSLTDFDLGLQLEAQAFANSFVYTTQQEYTTYTNGRGLLEQQLDILRNGGRDPGPTLYTKRTSTLTPEAQSEAVYNDKLNSLRSLAYTPRALDEYLKALKLRFVPFRRYHSVSSSVDLVWNGILGSENASYNAVDVTYFNEDAEPDEPGNPVGSQLVKAHAFLPESKLRVKPLQPYVNCRGYNMAMRYGMADLAMSLREMYRGELITLGNPRIMPWDIIILQDTYNSMVGPIEVEQVVHNFSHETGFITEIKPGAVVFTNEISSWPILEAMKLASLAIRNVHEDALGMTADSFGSALTMAEWITDMGPGGSNKSYQDHAKRKMKELYGENWDGNVVTDLSTTIFGDNPPGAEGTQRINDAADKVLDGVSAVTTSAAVIGAVSALGIGAIATKFKVPFGTKIVAPLGLGKSVGDAAITTVQSAAAGAFLASSLAIVADNVLAPPQLMSLLGGNLLMLQCLKGDSVMLVPLMKNGYPIVAGLNYHDPAMIWKNFLGDLGKFADDVIGGTRDMLDLWSIYGMYAWRRLPEWEQLKTDENGLLTGVNMQGGN